MSQLWPGMAARELTRYPVARLRMINTSLVGGCFATPRLSLCDYSNRGRFLQLPMACGDFTGMEILAAGRA